MQKCPSKLAVIGGGYVGLHTAIMAARKGVDEIIVVDVKKSVVDAINSGLRGRLHVKDYYVQEHWDEVKDKIRASLDYGDARGADAYIVAVQTPLSGRRVDYSPLRRVGESLAEIYESGVLISSETTIYPGGTVELLARPILERRGLKLDEELLLAHVPERINPGSREWSPERIPRVVGAVGARSLDAALRLYRDCFGLATHVVSDIRVAEASKLLENSFRLLNISYVNELKRVLDRLGIDIHEVVAAASTKPFGFMAFHPGPYAGGPCLPKDTRMMYEATGSSLLAAALRVNEEQPLYYAALVLREIRTLRRGVRRVLFYGLGYKPGAYTAIESPVLRVMEELRRLDPSLEVKGYDPIIRDASDFSDEDEALEWAEVVVAWGFEPPRKPVAGVIRLDKL